MLNDNNNLTMMKVDVRLCGQIPRDELTKHFGAPNSGISCLAETNGSSTLRKITVCDTSSARGLSGLIIPSTQNNNNNNNEITTDTMRQRGILTDSYQHQQQLPTQAPSVLEPPVWAVPARGETRLEPVGDSLGRQAAVDLTSQKAFRIGRSPSCDVQLMHATSSRRHAMLFHHSNGSCYIVDCGSAHGTFVNGRRISSPAVTGVVVPHKVRRGSLIRFGGPGAPTYVLKSFNFTLEDVKRDTDSFDEVVQIRRNTRLNALGKTAVESVMGNNTALYDAMAVVRKRSFDSLSSKDTLDLDEPDCKRMRCSSPPICEELIPIRLVSPDISVSCKRRVTFSLEPPQAFYPVSITPDESSEEDNVED